MMQRFAIHLLPWFAPLALFVAGCGHNSSLPSVEGIVTLDGKPLAGATLVFIPSGTVGEGASGTSGSDGSFRLVTRNHAGAKPGDYKILVQVTPPAKDPYTAYAEELQFRREPGPKKASGSSSSIPLIYSDVRTTPLHCTVPVEGKLVVELHSSGLPAKR
jgi:hypothetical protein